MKKTIPVTASLFIAKKKFDGIANLFGIPLFGNVFVVAGTTFICNSFLPGSDGSITGEMMHVMTIVERETAEKRLISAGFSIPIVTHITRKDLPEALQCVF
ncbi:MAG: hypothetical protein ABIO57_02170 [Candidatus Paceibacterota bacterium]